MSLLIVLRPLAEVDLLAARDWYERQSAGLGIDFGKAVDAALSRIVLMPEMYAVVFDAVRRAKLGRFPYLIYYRVLSDQIEVIAVLHSSRNPKVWQDRVN